MDRLFTLTPDPNGELAVQEWLSGEPHELFAIARQWFGRFRDCGEDVEVQIHDGFPTACVQEAAIGYVNVFKSHVNVGFFTGAFLDDPNKLLQGSGKRMRHVKIYPDSEVDSEAVALLIQNAYSDIKNRLT